MRQLVAASALAALAVAAFAQEIHIDDAGTVRQAQEVYIDDAGTVREIKEIYVDDGGTVRLVFTASLHETTITVGDDGVSQFGYNSASFGSIGSGTYTDGGAASRTIAIVQWDGATAQFWLNAGSVPDSDDTFSAILLNGTTLNRADATYNGAAAGGTRSSWVWSSAFFVASGSVALVIR